MKAALLGVALLCAAPAVAVAGQCPALHAQVEKVVGNRFDASASTARMKMMEANALHRSGKHVESVKAYEEAAKAGNVTLEMKK